MTEIIILSLLDKRPMYGAEMVEEIKKISGNTVIMSLPTLYSSLHRMAGKKWVNSYQKQSTIGGRCRVYNITKHGREYLSKNPIQIDYSTIINNDNNIISQAALASSNDIITEKTNNKTYTTLEDAFSLPLTKNIIPDHLPSDKRILTITPPPEPLKLDNTQKSSNQTLKSLPDILPYVEPTEKITTTPEPQYQQTLIGLTGTIGGNDLRPLIKLNKVKVGNDYVVINRLRMASTLISSLIFVIINFFCSLTHAAPAESYSLVYIILALYTLINLSIYFVYPRIKKIFYRKASFIRYSLSSLIAFILVLLYCFVNSMPNLLWLTIFTLLPLTQSIIMIMLRKRSWFEC